MQGIEISEVCIHALDEVRGVTMGKDIWGGMKEQVLNARELLAIVLFKKLEKGKSLNKGSKVEVCQQMQPMEPE